MKTNKFVEELKNKSANELNEELVAAKKELFNLRFQNATNQLKETFVIMVCIGAFGRVDRCCYGIGYQ